MNSQQKNLVSAIGALVVAAVLVLGMGLDLFGWMYTDADHANEEVVTTTSATATVWRITDGDTINIDVATGSDFVRLIGIDTPEIDWEASGRPEAACFGWEARDFLVGKLEGETVRLVGDPRQPSVDEYDRRLAYVYLDGELINQTLLEEGYARELTVGDGYEKQESFRAAEEAARQEGTGLWAVCEE
ncbi:MAG: thermonuclease family protein [Candidatus Paceibacterota bacterium]